MTPSPLSPSRLGALLRAQWSDLTRVAPSDLLWQMHFAAGLSAGLPICVGMWFGHIDYGLIPSLGGMNFLYTPNTALTRRMATLMACGFGMSACYALGVLAQQEPWARAPALALLAILITMLTRYFRMPPPGNFFFVLAATMGMFTPTPLLELPTAVGLVFLGAFLALLIAFFYSLFELRTRPHRPQQEPLGYAFDEVIFDATVIGVTIGASLAFALAIGLERPYWVPVSCASIIQGQNLRAVWTRQLLRIIGTAFGFVLALAILSLTLNGWWIGVAVGVLCFLVQTTVARHYGVAAVFMTPMTLLMTEAANPAAAAEPLALIEARFFDTVVGCLVGLAGAALIHRPRARALVSAPLRRIADAVLERS